MVLISACGKIAAPGESDVNMQPGKWEIRAWMENEQMPGDKIEEQVLSETLSPQDAQWPVANIIFGGFYHGSSPEHIQAEDGTISGYLEQGAVAPFPAHEQQVSGSYTKDSFTVVIEFPIGPGISQVVEGRLVEPFKGDQ